MMKRIRGWTAMAALVIAAIVIAEVPAIKQVDQAIGANQPLLLGMAIAATAAGFVLFMGGIISMLMAGGEAMDHQEIETSAASIRDAASRPYVWRASAFRIPGAAEGRQVANETTIAGMKGAWRSGDWRRDPDWRRIFVVATGAAMLAYGLFGIFIVTGPPYLKVLLGAALAFATLSIVRGAARA